MGRMRNWAFLFDVQVDDIYKSARSWKPSQEKSRVLLTYQTTGKASLAAVLRPEQVGFRTPRMVRAVRAPCSGTVGAGAWYLTQIPCFEHFSTINGPVIDGRYSPYAIWIL